MAHNAKQTSLNSFLRRAPAEPYANGDRVNALSKKQAEKETTPLSNKRKREALRVIENVTLASSGLASKPVTKPAIFDHVLSECHFFHQVSFLQRARNLSSVNLHSVQ
jgi:hypothetical protein